MKTTNLAPQKTKRSRGKIAVAAMLGLIALSAACAPAPDPAPTPPTVPVTVPVTVPASCANGRASCVLGDIGPGGGKVFYIDGVTRYEMAPNTWNGGASDPSGVLAWCDDAANSVTTGEAVGTGEANTASMLTDAPPFTACTTGAGNAAHDYAGGGLNDWFLPSFRELIAMCRYSRNPAIDPGDPMNGCTGAQDASFASSTYGFQTGSYSSSSQWSATQAFAVIFAGGHDGSIFKASVLPAIRPIRSF
jgi:hypothetical protein